MPNDLETFDPLTDPTWSGSICYAEAFRAKTLAARERARDLLATARGCGLNLPGLSSNSDRNGSSWKTSPPELGNGSTPYDLIWDDSDTEAFRSQFRARLLERLTNEPECLLWPTVTASRYGTTNNGNPGDGRGTYRTAGSPSLWTAARQWPTVVVTDRASTVVVTDRASTGRATTLAAEGSKMKVGRSLTDAMRLWQDHLAPAILRDGSNGSETAVLNPEFCGALLGFPPGWLELESEP